MPINPGSIIGGKYRLLRRLAIGGQGSIWVAEHIQLGSQVAIKFMDFAQISSPAALTRFEREARAAARLRHQNLVHVEDRGVEDGIPYLVMELFEGEDLLKRLKSVGLLSLDEVARITNQVARGLRRLHEAGYVHRDLKPGNIFLARNDEGEEVVKILDFGIVKQSEAEVGEGTKTGEFVGSPHYMSPEQIRNVKLVDARSDQWSLGVVMFRALTGQFPFPGEAIGAVVSNIIAGAARRPSEIVPALSPAIDAFFERVFARDPNQRFASAMEMAEAFARAAGARAPMPSIMDLGQAWEPASSSSPSGLPPAGPDLQGDALLEGTTLPRSPARSMGGTILIQDPPRPASSHPPASGYGQPAPPDRRTSDPMHHGSPGSSSGPPPPSGSPLSALKETQPLSREQIDKVRQARLNMSTVRMPTAQPGGAGQAGSAPSDPPSWKPPQPDGRQAGSAPYAYPGQEAQRRWDTPPPPSYPSFDPAAGGLEMQPPDGIRSNKVWVLGGLLLGTGFAVLIAIIALLIR
jgi:serine/threonine-protein kinase